MGTGCNIKHSHSQSCDSFGQYLEKAPNGINSTDSRTSGHFTQSDEPLNYGIMEILDLWRTSAPEDDFFFSPLNEAWRRPVSFSRGLCDINLWLVSVTCNLIGGGKIKWLRHNLQRGSSDLFSSKLEIVHGVRSWDKRRINFEHLIASWVDVGANAPGCETSSYSSKG